VKKILIVGGTGFVGGNLAAHARTKNEVIVFGHTTRFESENIDYRQVDITNEQEVLAAISEAAPTVVVNAAAISGIDFAEKNRELTWKVNVLGAEHVARACRAVDARHIFFSSGAVFAGKASSYSEQDAPSPINYYGKTKAEAEARVLANHTDSVVIRISLVLGYPLAEGNSFYSSLKDQLERGEKVGVPAREIRTPVDVHTLCEAVLELGEIDFAGIIHIGSTESISRFDLTRRIARALGFEPDLIEAKQAEQMVDRAPRHRNGIIDVQLAQRVLRTGMRDVDESIRRSIEK
jgi:dTDP-4-dehydrorhamnose reductase